MTLKELIKPLDLFTRVCIYLDAGNDEVIPLGESVLVDNLKKPGVTLTYGDYEVSFMSIMNSQEGVRLNIAIK